MINNMEDVVVFLIWNVFVWQFPSLSYHSSNPFSKESMQLKNFISKKIWHFIRFWSWYDCESDMALETNVITILCVMCIKNVYILYFIYVFYMYCIYVLIIYVLYRCTYYICILYVLYICPVYICMIRVHLNLS